MENIDWRLLISLLVMGLGLAGTFLPVVPGIPLIFLTMVVFDWINSFQDLGFYFLAVMFILAALSFIADYLCGVYGADKFGASNWGKAGVVIGGIIGLFFGPLGLILGPLVGVFAGEIISGKEPMEAIRSGGGAFLGILAGTVTKVAIALIMIIAFLIRVF